MSLPAISLPSIELPFSIPALLHPPVDHFAIALPVVILLLELINFIIKRRALSVTALFLMLVAIFMLAAAYLTGSVDGKEAFNTLSQAGQDELKGHKLLGIYLLIVSVFVLASKLFSMILSRTWAKALYMLLLVVLVVGLFKQGEEGGELVYEYGANVECIDTSSVTQPSEHQEPLPKVVPLIEVSPTEANQSEANQTDINQTFPLPEVTLPPVVTTHEVQGMPEEMVQPKIATH